MNASPVLLQLSVILAATSIFGALMRFIGQPKVIGEIAAGLALGPLFFGTLAPRMQTQLFGASQLTAIDVVAQIGLVLFMFSTGLELRHSLTSKRQLLTASLIGTLSFALPFALGAILGHWLFPRFAPPDVSRGLFSSFFGCALSITALPVMARILKDLALTATQFAVLAISAAAFADILSWLVLLTVTTFSKGNSDWGPIAMRSSALLLFTLVMLFVVRPILQSPAKVTASKRMSPTQSPVLLIVGLFACAMFTESLGVHAAFGALLFGVCAPQPQGTAASTTASLTTTTATLFLPAFFASVGLRADADALSWANLWVFGLILLAAIAGKISGAAIAARVSGQDWRSALCVGALMNARGLMELVAIKIGLDVGLITRDLFTMLLLMAVITTLLTAPMLRLLLRSASKSSTSDARGRGS